MNSFGQKLKCWRLNNGLSQADVAEILNYGLRSVQDWEHNYRLPGYDAIISVADMMGVSSDWLLGRTSDWRTTNQIIYELQSAENNL